MAEYSNYFNSRLSQEIAKQERDGISTKWDNLQRASAEKIQSLQQLENEQKAAELRHAQSWLGKLEIDPNSGLGIATNVAANFVSGASTQLGNTTGFLLGDIPAMLNQSMLNESDIQAINKYKGGIATPSDLLLINTKKRLANTGGLENRTPLEIFNAATENRRTSAAADKFYNNEHIVYSGRKDAFNAELSAGFAAPWEQVKEGATALGKGELGSGTKDIASGLAKLIFNAGESGFNNPIAITEYIAENAPQFLVGAIPGIGGAALGLTNVAYASEHYQKGITKFQSENNGALPPLQQRMEMAGWAASTAIAEQVGDKIGLKGATKAVDEIRTGFKNSLKNVGTAGVKGFGTESFTEGYQTFAEGKANLTPSTPEQIYQGGVIGGFVGGGLSGGVQTGRELTGNTEDKAALRQHAGNIKAAAQEAIKTGDYTSLLDPKSPTYAPETAVSALFHAATLPDATPEVKKANFEQANEILSSLSTQAERLNDLLNTPKDELLPAETNDKFIADAMLRINDPATTPATKNKLEKLVGEAEQQTLALSKKGRFKLTRELEATKAKLAQSEAQMVNFNHENQKSAIDVVAEVEATRNPINTPETLAAKNESAHKLMKMAMIVPESLDVTTAEELANNINLDESTRTYFRAFSASKLAEHATENVEKINRGIFTKSSPRKASDTSTIFNSIPDYKDQFAIAVSANKESTAAFKLLGISNFSKDHAAKLAMAKLAVEEASKRKGDSRQLIKAYTGTANTGPYTWEINKGTLLNKVDLAKNGGLNLHINSTKIMTAMELESVAITAAAAEMQAAFNIHFPTSTQVSSNVQVSTPSQQTGTGTQSATQTTSVEATAPVGEVGVSNTGRTPVNEVNSTVEAGDVTKESLVSIMDTDGLYASWSNVRDGSDRSTFTDLIKATIATFSKIDLTGKEALVTKDLKNQKWFKSATADQQAAFVKGLVSQSSKTTPAKPLPELGSTQQVTQQQTTSQPVEKSIPSTNQGANHGEIQKATQAEVLSKTGGVTTPGSSTKTKETNAAQPTEAVKEESSKESQEAKKEAVVTDYVDQANPPEFARKKEVAKAEGADFVFAPLGVQGSYASRLAEQANKDGKLVDPSDTEDIRDKVVYVSVPGASRNFTGMTKFIADVLKLLDRGAIIRTDNNANAGSSHNAAGEGKLRVALAFGNYNLTEGALFDSWQKNLPRKVTKPVVTQEAPASAVNTQEVVSTEQVEQPAVGEATTIVEEEATEVQDGTLQAVKGKIDETKAYAERILAHYFTQIAGSIKDGSLRPLVAVKGFISWLGKDVSRAIQYVKHLTDNDSLTEEQIRALKLFASKSAEWQGLIKDELIMKIGKSEAFKYEDMMQFFMQKDELSSLVDIEENLKTAMTYAIFNYVITEAGEYPFFKNEEINKLLGRDKDHLVTTEERKVFHHKMMTINDVQNALGKAVFKAMGFQATKGIPTDVQPRLESAFGVHVMGLMENLKLVTVEQIPYEMWNKFKKKKEGDTNFYVDEVAEATKTGFEKEKVVTTVRLARNSSMVEDKEVFEHIPLVAEIVEANKDSKGILDKLFTLEPGVREPSLKPIPLKKTKPSRSTQGFPALLKESLELTQKSARKIDATRMDLLLKLGDDIAMEIGGVDNESEGNKAHINNRDGNRAKNDALRKEWKMLREFVEGTLYKGKEGKDTPFYLEFEAWIMQRVGIKTQAGNPLSSKIARGVLYSPKWEAKIKMDDLKSFKLRVLEGLGAKTDRKSNELSLKEFNDTFDSNAQEPKVKEKADKLNAAIDAIIASFSGEITEEQKQAILIGSKVGGEKMHSFAALVAMAQYRDALNKGKKHFTARMMGEMDGVTSGIMLSTLLYGAGQSVDAMFNRLNKGGLYRADEPSAYNLWRGMAGHKDQYESFAFTLESFLGKAEASPRLTAIYGFIGSLTTDGNVTSQWRNFIKPAINAIAFGSGTKTVTERLGEAMIETYYASIEKAFANNDEAAAETIINNINQLLAGDYKIKPMLLAELMETPLTYVQTNIIKQSFSEVFGVPIKAAMEQEFEHYVKKRNVVVQSSTVAFTIYSALKKSIREAYIKELMAEHAKDPTKGIATTKDKGVLIPIHDLTQEQEDEVTKRMHGIIPLVHTAMSKRDGDINTGILLSKPKSNVVYSTVNHSKVKYVINDKSVVNTYATRRSETNVGVSVLSKLLHAFDSAIMQQAIIEFGGHTFSAHDAGGTGIDTVDALGTTLNKYLWNELMNYSPAMEVYDMYALMLKTLADNIDSIPKETLIAIRNDLETSKLLQKEHSGSVSKLIDLTLTNIKDTADQSDQMKYETLAVTAVVNQYSGETGVYTPTDEQRAEAALRAKQSSANAGTPKAILDAAAVIGDKLNALPPREVFTAAPKEAVPDVDLNTKFNLSNKDAIAALSKDPKKQFEFIIGQLKSLPNKDLDALISTRQGNDKAKDIAKLIGFLGTQTTKTKATIDNSNNWGGLGKPRQEAPPILFNAFNKAKNQTISAKELLVVVKQNYKDSKKSATQKLFYTSLINAISAAISDKLVVTMITKDTDQYVVDPKEGAKGAPDKAAAWYDPLKDKIGHIYLLGPDYSRSEMSSMMILHEILHAATSWAIHEAKGNPNHKAVILIKQLENIREAAIKYIANNKEYFEEHGRNFTYELHNIQELISYGLTDPIFQREVLEKTIMPTNKGGYSLINGMRAFVDAITDYFFGGKATTKDKKTAMAELIYSASALLSEESKSLVEDRNETYAPINAKDGMVNTASNFTTAEIHEALDDGKITSGFSDHLQRLLDGVVTKLHGPFGSLKAHIAQSTVTDPMDLWLEALSTGKLPFATELASLPIAMGQQEAFVADQVYVTVQAALDTHEGTTKVAYKRLERLYEETRTRLTAADFDGGQTEYDAIFKEESNAEGKSDHLARFAALGLANQQLNRLLHVPTSLKMDTSNKKKEKKYVSAWLQTIFENILEFFASKYTHTPAGTQANVMLNALVEQLVMIEQKRVEQINSNHFLDNVGAALDSKAAQVTGAIAKKVSSLARSNFVAKNKYAGVKAAGALVDTIASQRVKFLLDETRKAYDYQFKGKQGLAGELLAYTVGALPKFQALMRTLKHLEGVRKDKITQLGQFTLEAFGSALTDKESKGLTVSLLRTGAHNLLSDFALADIANLISDPATLAAEIKNYEAKVTSFGRLAPYYLHQANALAALVALGGGRDEFTMMNAHNIANLHGTGQEKYLKGVDVKAAEAAIKTLVTLYALDYTHKDHKKEATKVIHAEMLRSMETGENGFEFVLLTHKALEEKSLQDLFGGNPILMQHGYTPEIYDPHIDVKIANVKEGKDLINQGYRLAERLPVDPSDPQSEVKHLYVMQGKGLPRRVSGFISNTGEAAKGSLKHNGFTNPFFADGMANADLQNTITINKQAAIKRMFQAGPRKDLSKTQRTYMVPLFNDAGEIRNWRYMMQEKTKDLTLNRTSAIDKVLGKFAGSIYDKVSSKEHNKNAIAALREEYMTGKGTSPNAYIAIGPKSSDPELREIWNLMSQNAKDEVKAVWGKDEILVRGDHKNIIFGYQKYEIANLFTKEERNVLEEGFVNIVEWVLEEYARYGLHKTPQEAKNHARRAAMNIAKGQRAWQEIVQAAKDNIVVKSVTVLMGNHFSNVTQLRIAGVAFKDIAHHSLVAYRAAVDYNRDNKELAKYEQMLEVGYIKISRAEIERNILKLKNAIARNPVKKMIDAGMMPTIVEDISAEEDPYSYKSALMQSITKYTDKMNPTVLDVSKNLLLTHDTAAYKGLSRMVQLSDFVARYTLYQHVTTRKNNPLSEEDALHEASEAFVNYDIPMPKAMQFMDDMGFMIFTKYFFSIQRQLVKLSNEHPLQVLMTVLIDNFINLGPTVLQGSFLSHFGNNPFGMGILNFHHSVGEIATVNTALSLID